MCNPVIIKKPFLISYNAFAGTSLGSNPIFLSLFSGILEQKTLQRQNKSSYDRKLGSYKCNLCYMQAAGHVCALTLLTEISLWRMEYMLTDE